MYGDSGNIPVGDSVRIVLRISSTLASQNRATVRTPGLYGGFNGLGFISRGVSVECASGLCHTRIYKGYE